MSTVAHFIATHPVEVFLGATVIGLGLVALAWRVLQRVREPVWTALNARIGVDAWMRRMPLLRRIERPDAALGALALDLLSGFAVVLFALFIFFALSDEIGLDEELGQFDHALAAELAERVPAPTLRAFALVTRLADAEVQTAICIVVALLLYARGRRLLMLTWIAVVAGNGSLTRLLKWGFGRERPLHDHGWIVEHSWSFPSGHASGALAVYGMLAYLLVRATQRMWHLPIVLVASALVFTIGWSRVVLQVHYLSDVLAGWAVAGAWLILCIATARLIRAHRSPVRA